MTREQKINMLVDQVLEDGISETWVDGFKEGLRVMYDATTIDFQSRTCENCSLFDECEATLGLSELYPSHTYIKEIVGGYCMNFERKEDV